MSFEAQFVHGSPLMIDYEASGDVAAGEVVPFGNMIAICHHAIDYSENPLGALALGGGVYDGAKDDSSGPDITAGEEVYFIAADNQFTNLATGNLFAGYAIEDAGASAATVRFAHVANDVSADT